MSIEMENPKTLLEKLDAAENHVAQINLAILCRDYSRASSAAQKASELLFDAKLMVAE